MNKVLFKKMAETVANGGDIKQLFTKEEVRQFVIEQIKTQILLAVAPILGKLIVVCLVIGVLLAIFFILFEQLSALWDGVTKAWGHLWSGTVSQVSDDDVSILYYDLLQQGVDFEEIGAIGEHNFIEPGGFWNTKNWLESFIDNPKLHEDVETILNSNGMREKYTLQYYLDTITEADIRPVKVNKSKLDYINNKDPDRELSNVIEMVDKVDKNGNIVYETLEQAAVRKLSEQLMIFKGVNVGKEEYKSYQQLNVDKGIGVYLKRYLMAEKETFSQRNSWTFANEGFKGAIYIDGGEKEIFYNKDIKLDPVASFFLSFAGVPQNVFDMFGEAAIRAYQVERDEETRDMYVNVNAKKSVVDPLSTGNKVSLSEEPIRFNISQFVENFAMPWQYPFAFHQQTLSPDVGYEVALMAHKYHNLYLQVRGVETGTVKVYNEYGNQLTTEPIRQPQIFVRETSTWYQTINKDYSKDPNNAWHGVAKDVAINYNEIQNVNKDTPDSENVKTTEILLIQTTVTKSCDCGEKDDVDIGKKAAVYWTGEKPETYINTTTSEHTTSDSEGNDSICNVTTTVVTNYEKNFIKTCTYEYEDKPVITISDTISKQEQVKLTGVEAMTALLLPDPQIDATTKKVTNFDEAARYYRANDLSIKNDAQGTYTKDLLFISTSAQSIIKSLYDLYSNNKYTYEPTDYENIEHVIDSNDSSFMIDKSTPKYLALEGNYQIIVELIQFFAANGIIDASTIYGLGEANSFAIMAQWFISGNSVNITTSGNIATLMTGSGREVTAPATGTISKMSDSGYIYIKTEKQGAIYLSNIQLDDSIKLGQTVTKGQKIGVTTGNVSYYRLDDAGQEIANPADELRQIQTIKFSDYAWPLPDSGNITSRFGSRIDPITGQASRHNGVDIGAKQGTPIVSYMAGEIYKAGYDPDGYGYYIIVKHSDNSYTLYGHMVGFVKRSGTVEKNEPIGYVGSTGRSTGPHLHFEYRTGPNYADAIDPMSKLSNYNHY